MTLHNYFPGVSRQVSQRAILYMILASVCFAVVEQGGGRLIEGVTVYQVTWGRYAIHLLFMLTVLGPRYKTTLVRTQNLKLQIVRSLTMFAMPVCFILAVQHVPSHDVWSVYWTSPMIILALSTWVLGERAGIIRWVAAAVGFAGMLLVLRPDQAVLSPASILSFGVGLALSMHLMFSRILRYDHPLTSLFHTALWVFVLMSFIMPFVWQPPSLINLVGIVMIGIVGMLGLGFLARAGELAPLPIVAAFGYTEALARLFLDLFVFQVAPSKSMLVGCAIVTVVTGFLLYYELRQPQREVARRTSDVQA